MRADHLTILALLEESLHAGEAPVGPNAEDLENALANHRAAFEVRRLAEELEQNTAAEVERYLGRDYYKTGPNVFAVQQSASWTILDPEKAWRYVETINTEEGFAYARPLLDLAPRKLAWVAMAERRGLPVEATITTFLIRRYGPIGLQTIPLDVAPKYVQEAADGIVTKKTRTPKGGSDGE